MLKMTLKIAAFVAIYAASAGAAGAASTALSGDVLRNAVSDKTVVLKISGFELPIRYSSSGTMTGRMSAFAAAFSGSKGVSDHGKWWVDGHKLCQKWSNWMDGATYCYALSEQGKNNVRWVRNDGRSGTARIAG